MRQTEPDEDALAAALHAEAETCERLIDLLRRQRAAVLGPREEDIWTSTCHLGEELQRLERLLQPDASADLRPLPPPPISLNALRRRLQMSQERLRLESQVSQEILADLLAYLEFCRRSLGLEVPVSYSQGGAVNLASLSGERCNQEA
ncbi:MAG TPA: hypothetical protein VGM19_01870 [Armatimonadota bacterium]|jgi:hypothetical protein